MQKFVQKFFYGQNLRLEETIVRSLIDLPLVNCDIGCTCLFWYYNLFFKLFFCLKKILI